MFDGFPRDGVAFLQEIVDNNSKQWFATHKARFKKNLEQPAKDFAVAMEDELGQEWTGKVFRFYRDLRFSKDKTPYNTHMRIGFTAEGEPSLFFSLEPTQLILGSGLFELSKEALERYRQAVQDERGEQLESLLAFYEKKGYRLDEPELKRVPRGCPKDHPRADLLRRKSLALWLDKPVPKAIHGSKALAHCLGVYQELTDFRAWLRGVL